METTIIIKDELRDEVERASGGKQTIIRTVKGMASIMNIIPAFRCEDLHPTAFGTGLHPAFIVNGVEKKEILIGTYQAIIVDGEAVSQQLQKPVTSINFDQARAACLAAGPGFHLMTNWEWAAIALWCLSNGHDVRGNTNYGKSHSHPDETGTCPPNSSTTLTGSGPDSWRHDGTPFGIADLVGNAWEWNDGLKLVSGKIIMPADNNFNLPEAEWPETGTVIDFTSANPIISDEITDRDWDGCYFNDLAAKSDYNVPQAITQALLWPFEGSQIPGYFWAGNSEGFEALPFRGGNWNDASDAGLGALRLACRRSIVISNFGFRPAFIA